MDTVSQAKRSWIMAQVKSFGARSTEERFRGLLQQHRITGWRRNYPLFGKPDFVFPKARVAVFLDGCFWHGHPERCRMPQANRPYWQRKIERNVARDRAVNRRLRERGWKVLRIWEHRVAATATLLRVKKALLTNEG